MSTCTEWTFDSVDGEEIPVELLRRRARGDANLPPDPSSDAVRRPAREGAIQAACGVGPVEENFAVGP